MGQVDAAHAHAITDHHPTTNINQPVRSAEDLPHGEKDDQRRGRGAPQKYERHQQLGVHWTECTDRDRVRDLWQ